ncbi:hypothetical protein J113_14900 [Mycobacterium tuberculosis CAS/NITR204]|uniref:Uncharacterized protein n=1 Tax=Mycobacterium tuberculosis CAS/NITR204 TaxID=1310114 RepID=R4MI40_MYCTX|nr:hypothetical protein J113_14900 [Mycobacterium tuberculosis CAS/NITR204]
MSAPRSSSSISSLGVLGGLTADLRIGAGAQPAGGVAADVEFDVGIAHQQRLGVGVDRDEFHAFEALLDHSVDGVDTATTDTHDLDDGQVVVRGGHRSASSLVGLGSSVCLLANSQPQP